MDAVVTNLIIGHSLVVLTAIGALAYLYRLRIERPPIGVFNLRDVCFTVVVLAVIPVLYLHLSKVVLGALLTLFGFAITNQTLTPLVTRRAVRLLLVLALCAAEVGLVTGGHAGTPLFHAVNDLAMMILAIGVSNTWAQSGIRARHVAVFAVVVAGYDLVATGFMTTTADLAKRLSDLPFVPWVGWGSGPDAGFTGLGDVLFIALWPLVVTKAYSAAAGRAALVVTMGCISVVAGLSLTGLLTGAIPTMVFVGPVIALHWWWLHRRHPRERTAGEFEATRGSGGPVVRPSTDLTRALALLADAPAAATYHAMHEGEVLASGTDVVAVLDAAGQRRPDVVPVVVLA